MNTRQDGTIVLTFGTFDKFHKGHEFFLSKAKEYGDFLFVVVARDNNVVKIKGKEPTENEAIRLRKVSEFEVVYEALLGFEDFSQKDSVIDIVNPQIICLGYDQALNFTPPDLNIQVIRIEAFHPEKYKSSLL